MYDILYTASLICTIYMAWYVISTLVYIRKNIDKCMDLTKQIHDTTAISRSETKAGIRVIADYLNQQKPELQWPGTNEHIKDNYASRDYKSNTFQNNTIQNSASDTNEPVTEEFETEGNSQRYPKPQQAIAIPLVPVDQTERG